MPDNDLPFGDMEDTMSDAFDKLDADEGDDTSSDETSSDNEIESDEAEFEGEGSEDSEEESEEVDDDTSDNDQEGGEGDGESGDSDKVEPPVSWSKEEQEAFLKLPSGIQEVVARRESEREAGLQEKLQGATYAQERLGALERIVAPRRQGWAAQGLGEAQAIEQLIALSDMANNKPGEFIQWLAKTTNYDLDNLLDEGGDDYDGGEEDSVSPEIVNRLNQLEGLVAQNAEIERQAVQSQAQDVYNQFVDEKDGSGQPKHPHFAKVQNVMGTLIQMSQAASLDEAYAKAIWLDPEIKDKLIQENVKKAVNGGKKKNSLNRAKSAASVNKKSNGGSGVTKKALGKTFEDTMGATYDEVNA